MEAPRYSIEKVPAGHCSRYARLVAHDFFGMHYEDADALELRKNMGL
ncbi:MAG: hypothetical protein AABW80_00780 [Nanoarchaeota archaeon]